MSDTNTVNTKEHETDVLASAAHPEGRMHIIGRSGRDYGVYRPGQLAWVNPLDLDDAWAELPHKAVTVKREAKAKDE